MNPSLQPADKPVIDGLESMEIVYAKDQPEYLPLRTLRAPDGRVFSRWSMTDEQRRAVAEGADIFVQVLTFNEPLQPLSLLVAHEIDPASAVETFNLDPASLLERLA